MKNDFLNATYAGLLLMVSNIVNVASAGVIIEYSDVGSDLLFSWSGSLAAAAGDGINNTSIDNRATVGLQNSGNDQTFYSSTFHGASYAASTYLGANNPGLFATLAPSYSPVMSGSTSTGTLFWFRINNAITGITSVDIWGDWGLAGSPIIGSMTIANHSIASLGMVNGYSIETNIGSISFQSASIPEPSTLAIFASGLMVLVSRTKRFRGMGTARATPRRS